MRLFLLAIAFLCGAAQAATFQATGTQTPWGLYAGSGTGSRISSHATFDDCVKAAAAIATKEGKATCRPPASNVTISAVVVVPPPLPATWTKIGDEGASLTVPTNSTVRYGNDTAWIEKAISGAFSCSNSYFGSDPLPGIVKECDLKTSSSSPPPATGSATLSWIAPTTNADGTPLTDLAGYRVLYGPASGTYTQAVTVSSTSLTVPNLAAGSWFFIVKAVDTSGNESAPSIELSKVVP